MPPKKTETMYDLYFKITQEILQKYGKTTILFYQVGAFFEMYGLQNTQTKAISKSQVEYFCQIAQLNISQQNVFTPEGEVLMAGFRDYSLDKYLKIATQNDYTAVVYVQNTTNPKAITRDFYGVYSPGTYISFDTESSQQLSNNTVCLWLSTYTPLHTKKPQLVCGISSAHIFTGESAIFEYETPFLMSPTTFDELERYVSVISPSEAIIISHLSDKETNQVIQYAGLKTNSVHIINMETETNIEKRNIIEKCQKEVFISHVLSTFFGTDSYNVCKEFQMYPTGTYSLTYLLHFLQERNPDLVKKITPPLFYNSSHRVILANHTLQQLNIIDDQTADSKRAGRFSSVASFLNRCCTPMGRRIIHRQITNPTTNKEWLNEQYHMISLFMTNPQEIIETVRAQLRQIRDLEKICRQIVVQKVLPNTIYQMNQSVNTIHSLISRFSDDENIVPQKDDTSIEESSKNILNFIHSMLHIDRCKSVDSISNFQENIFKRGIFENLDTVADDYERYKSLFDKIHKTFNHIMKTQTSDDTEYVKIHETEKSGVSLQMTKKRAETLRNKLTITSLEIAPDFIIQTKDIRFIKATSSSAAEEKIEFPQLTALLKRLFESKEQLSAEIGKAFSSFLRTFEKEMYEDMERIIQWTIRLDILQSKTYVAKKYNYCRPSIHPDAERSFFDARCMRHVLIEHIQQNEVYVTNDLALSSPDDGTEYDGILIFGTNAVGKTSLIRSIGICIIMAQSGFFVPCEAFTYHPYSSVFSRILGNDNLFKGLSTFAVEMSELRVILKSADNKSLVLGDELCSGTEMESALSLFSAGLVELSQKGATFLFATHFHEITKYDEIRALPRLGLKHMTVRYDPSTQILLYDRVLKDGQGSRIYGLEVCRSLYMDPGFLERAYAFRNKYFPEEGGELGFEKTTYNARKIRGKCELCHKEIASETHHLSPQRDADSAGFIGGFHKNHPGNLAGVCEACHLLVHKEDKKLVKKKSTKGYVLEVCP